MVRKNKWWVDKLPFSMSTSMLWSEHTTWSRVLATTLGWQPTNPSSQPTSVVEIFPTQDPLSPRCTSQPVAAWYTWLNLPPQPKEKMMVTHFVVLRRMRIFFFVWSRVVIFLVVRSWRRISREPARVVLDCQGSWCPWTTSGEVLDTSNNQGGIYLLLSPNDVVTREEIKLIFRYLNIRNLPLYTSMTLVVVSTGLAPFLHF